MPYCLKDTDLKQYINKYISRLKSENGDASLKRKHAYYYQTQHKTTNIHCWEALL